MLPDFNTSKLTNLLKKTISVDWILLLKGVKILNFSGLGKWFKKSTEVRLLEEQSSLSNSTQPLTFKEISLLEEQSSLFKFLNSLTSKSPPSNLVVMPACFLALFIFKILISFTPNLSSRVGYFQFKYSCQVLPLNSSSLV